MKTVLVVFLLALSGCAGLQDAWNAANRPDIDVQRSPLTEDGWNQESRFVVVVAEAEPHHVVIEATSTDGRSIREEGFIGGSESLEIHLADGTWDVTYTIDGHRWESFAGVRVDATPPWLTGLERVGDATDGSYVIGAGAAVEPGAAVSIYRAGELLATSLPHTVHGLGPGITVFDVVARDAAGNEHIQAVQVRVGDAAALPEGAYDFGIVARYSNEARLWDLADMGAYLSPADAAAEAGSWLGSGYGITPEHPAVQQVVADVITTESTTMEIAWSLYRWLYDELEYDESRLSSTTLMLPAQVIGDTEDPDAEAISSQDAGNDGLADDGAGNGILGGVCRDLAATYVSLLRAAGVPARLVSGYLAGNVEGFHAWVEFYGGDVAGNPGPWIPVDVSPIDGVWNDGSAVPRGLATAMQSFGITLPQYLALRDIPAHAEVAGWSTALSTHYTYPQSSSEPSVRFENAVTTISAQTGTLCFDAALARSIRTAGNCSGSHFPGFVVFAEQIIDYGVSVQRAGPGTEITASLAHPFEDSIAPDAVEWFVYGHPHERNDGRATATFRG